MKSKKIFTWFLRKDLSLKDRWWHRLFGVIYVLAFFVFIGIFFSSGDFGMFDYPQWKMVNTVGDRINSDLNSLASLTKSGERVDRIDSSSYNFRIPESESLFGGYFKNDIYCSNQIHGYVDKIMRDREVRHLYVGGKEVSRKDFLVSIKNINTNCIFVDSYTQYGTDGKEDGKLYFLRSDKDFYFGKGLSENLGFYVVSVPKSILFFVLDFIMILIQVSVIFYIISILYHKLILYIIFGKEKVPVKKH